MTDLILDTAIVHLYLMGKYNSNLIPKFKYTKKYTKDDYHLLDNILLKSGISRIYITPQVVTEISNQSFQQIEESDHEKLVESLKKVFGNYNEEYVQLEILLENENLSKFGFTDISIIEAAKRTKSTILTDDWPLNFKARSLGYKSFTFTEIRSESWNWQDL